MDTLAAVIRIEFSTADHQQAMDTLNRIVSQIEWSSDIIEDVYIEEAPTPEDE